MFARSKNETVGQSPGSNGADVHVAGKPSRGVLLISLGTPSGVDVGSVRSYLAEFLSDPEVIRLPSGLGWLNGPLGRLIAHFRGPKSAEMYRRIWTEDGSPLSTIAQEQADKLQAALPPDWRVFVGMRYGKDSIDDAVKQAADAGIEELVVVPMYPQFSGPTTGTALRELYRSLQNRHHHMNVSTRNSWYDDGGYVHSQAKLIEEYAQAHNLSPANSYLVFSVHGLPVSYVKKGDPYPTHIRRTVQLVAERLGWPKNRMALAFQSRFGPVEWLKPYADEFLCELAESGEKRVLVCPLSFTADCLETLEEIDVRYREQFEGVGGDLYLCPALNASATFISALKDLVLRGPKPVLSWGQKVTPLLHKQNESPVSTEWIDSLVMVGVSVKNRVDRRDGPLLGFADEADLQRVKKPQSELPELLRQICANGCVREAFVWNTCHRFEFYGWSRDDSALDGRSCIVAQTQKYLFNSDDLHDVQVNVLSGIDAWHHLMRTVSGLNSQLPGDRDIIEQLDAAHRLATRAGTGGPLVDKIVSEIVTNEKNLRKETKWGQFDPGYCYAALASLAKSREMDYRDFRFVVIGGSTTSRSVLNALVHRFDVPSKMLTVVYRGHGGGHIKALRRAVVNGRRVRVQSYQERAVVDAIQAADVVVFGIDRNEPVLSAADFQSDRDYSENPLTIIDFNSFGSCDGVEAIPGVTVIDANQLDCFVDGFAESMCEDTAFPVACEEAEAWIREHRPTAVPAVGCQVSSAKYEKTAGGGRNDSGTRRWQECVECAKKCQNEGLTNKERCV